MVTVQPHIRASWGGSLGVPGVEVWTNSINMMGLTGGATAAASGANLRGLLPDLAQIVGDWFGEAGSNSRGVSGISSYAHLEWVKLNFIGADGKYRDDPNTLLLPAPINGGNHISSVQVVPPQIWQQSSVITFLTAIGRGRGSHGRIYPPACGAGVGSDGYMDAQFCAAMQQNAVRFLGDLNKLAGQGGSGLFLNACIVSAARGGKPAINTPITRLHVDRIPDVQRRRVNRVKVNSLDNTTIFLNT